MRLGTNDTKMALLPARSPQPIKGDRYTVAHKSSIPVGQNLERRERMEMVLQGEGHTANTWRPCRMKPSCRDHEWFGLVWTDGEREDAPEETGEVAGTGLEGPDDFSEGRWPSETRGKEITAVLLRLEPALVFLGRLRCRWDTWESRNPPAGCGVHSLGKGWDTTDQPLRGDGKEEDSIGRRDSSLQTIWLGGKKESANSINPLRKKEGSGTVRHMK